MILLVHDFSLFSSPDLLDGGQNPETNTRNPNPNSDLLVGWLEKQTNILPNGSFMVSFWETSLIHKLLLFVSGDFFTDSVMVKNNFSPPFGDYFFPSTNNANLSLGPGQNRHNINCALHF